MGSDGLMVWAKFTSAGTSPTAAVRTVCIMCGRRPALWGVDREGNEVVFGKWQAMDMSLPAREGCLSIMRLHIWRNQADQRGVFGGHKGVQFSLRCRLTLTEHERQLVERYKLGSHVLTRNGAGVPLTVNQIIDSHVEQMPTVELLVNNEKVIKEACQGFKVLLDIASTFGGEEVVEID
jgi:hypothetical protein